MGFGDFVTICENTPLPLCSLIGPSNLITGAHGVQTQCSSRTIELANTIIFQGANGFAHILVLQVVVMMILHIRTKFTAVGRKEIQVFFYCYALLTICSLLVDCGVVPPNSSVFPYFVALQCGLASATCISLMINGFVGFQLFEDGTTLSIWLLRSCSFAMFAMSFIVALLTFEGWAGLGPENTVGLFVVVYLFSAIFVFVYIVTQIILVLGTLEERWPLWHIAFGIIAFVVGQIVLYVLSLDICNSFEHYLDGLFVTTLCNLLAVMTVYKFWDSITKEDLEFSVGQHKVNFDYRESGQDADRRGTVYQDSEFANSAFLHNSGRRGSSMGY